MKNELVLDNYGVMEMHSEEQKEVDGGYWAAVLRAAYLLTGHVLWEMAMNPNAHREAEAAGFKSTCGC